MCGKYVIFVNVCLFIFGCFVSVESQRGYNCKTPNEEEATCISIYDCNLFLKTIRNKVPSQLKFIKNSQCGFDTNALVCCGTAVDYTNFEIPIAERMGTLEKNEFTKNPAIPDRSFCGFQESDKNSIAEFIFGGEESALNEFPWMAILGYTSPSGSMKWSCGGSIISDRYILTAAHCTTGPVQTLVGKLTHVKLGEHNLETTIDCDPNGNCNDKPLIIGVESVTPHELYNPQDKFNKNDISIVRLKQKINFSDFVKPICLAEEDEASVKGDILTTAGWGKIEGDLNTAVKLKVNLPFLGKEECNIAFRSNNLQLSESQLCAGGESGKDSCRGDSGGPLMRRSKSNINQWYQEGIVSFGASTCGAEGKPGIYTKVSSFLPWIHRHIRN